MSLLILGWINLAYVRVPGVLQRFAICYFVVAITGVLAARIHGDEDDSEKVIQGFVVQRETLLLINQLAILPLASVCLSLQKGLWRKVEDITKHYTRWAVAFALLIVHTLITFLLPVPGCPTGYLGPAGLHEDNAHAPECVGGATGYIDRQILTADHIYQVGHRPNYDSVVSTGIS